MTVGKTYEKVLRLKFDHDFNNKSESRIFSYLLEKSYNKTVIILTSNFGRHKNLSTLRSDIHHGLAALVIYHFFGEIKSHIYLNEVNNCILFDIHII